MRRILWLLLGVVLMPVAAAAQAPAETTEYYGTDATGSIRIVWDAAATVVGRQDYAPFGRPLVPVPAMPKEGFGGQEKDDETDQAYFHARMFEARTGRFTRTDSIFAGMFEPQRWNRYAYGLNNPVQYVDPSGENAECDPNTCPQVTARYIPVDGARAVIIYLTHSYSYAIVGAWLPRNPPRPH